jgi:threonine dehydrogenase-like Zn-dependent dehydrogenase
VSPDCHITTLARHPHQAETARRLGADEVVSGEDDYQAVARITGARLYAGMFGNRMLLGGFDVVYDCVGSAHTLHDSLRWARAGGAVVMVGIKLSPLKLDLSPIWCQEVDLVGLYAHGAEVWQGKPWRTYDLVVELMRQGKLTVEGLITHRFPLSQWKQAIAIARDKRSGSVKVVLDYGGIL